MRRQHIQSEALKRARAKCRANGNHPSMTAMCGEAYLDSYTVSYLWRTGQGHQEWLKETRNERLGLSPE